MDIWDSITNCDDYQRGYEIGKNDAKKGANRNWTNMVNKDNALKFAIHGNKTLETYVEGYKTGYERGMFLKDLITDSSNNNQIINNTNIGHMSNGANVQQLRKEIEALEDMYNFLVERNNHILELSGRMQGYVNILESSGVAAEVCERYRKDFLNKDRHILQMLSDNIIQRDLPQIKKYKEMINNQHVAATNSSYSAKSLRTPNTSIGPIAPKKAFSGSGNREQDLKIQANASAYFMNFLVDEFKETYDALRQYQEYFQRMIVYGVPKQICDHFQNNYARNDVNGFKNIMQNFKNSDYVFIDRVFAEVVNTLGALGFSPEFTPEKMP